MVFIIKRVLLYILVTVSTVSCRIHKLSLTNDERTYVALTTFGFFKGGVLEVHMIDFRLPTGTSDWSALYGFTLDRTLNDAVNPHVLFMNEICILDVHERRDRTTDTHPSLIILILDLENLRVKIVCQGQTEAVQLFPNLAQQRSRSPFINYLSRTKDINENFTKCSETVLNITKETRGVYDYYNTSFAMFVSSESQDGIYNLYFHNCARPAKNNVPVNTMIEIYESNSGNFLSAGEMPLPKLYSYMSLVFFLSASLWTYILKTSKNTVYRIHIIMCVLVYLKSLSLAFHAINYHFIQTRGEHVTAWAILYYITHLLKGAVLFVTIVLVGTGWNFIKNILADRDKKLFIFVIPLQVVANVAEIIIAESEEGDVEHNAWRDMFIFVDLLCCGAILFPVVWSIRHLQDASTTDGKAAINLRKLKLFRQFYIMVVCYIYFTRFIVSLLKISVSFQYEWIDEFSREMATLVFFVMTGYKFRPAAANPYFTPNFQDDVEPQVLSDIGVLEGVTKVQRVGEKKREDLQPLMQDTNYNSD